jgi:hypothetical protein
MRNRFSAEILEKYRDFLKAFPGPQNTKRATETDVICPHPDHDDKHPSLGVDLRANGRGPEILLNCRACGGDRKVILEAVGKIDQDRFLDPDRRDGALPGCTLEQYAEYKHLPLEFLASDEVALEDDTRWCPVAEKQVPAVRIPYATEDGEELAECSPYRTGLRKTSPDTRMRAVSRKQGGKLTLYGRHRLEEARVAGYVFVCEGESDVHTLWYHRQPAVGVPGAQNWDDAWGAFLKGIPRIYVFIEPDAAGEKLWEAVSNCPALKGHVRRVVPG